MDNVTSLMMAKFDRINAAERSVQRRLRLVLEHMNVSDDERAVAMNCALYRVRHGGHPATAMAEALGYARRREEEHNKRAAGEWYRLRGDRFVPAWQGPDGAA